MPNFFDFLIFFTYLLQMHNKWPKLESAEQVSCELLADVALVFYLLKKCLGLGAIFSLVWNYL